MAVGDGGSCGSGGAWIETFMQWKTYYPCPYLFPRSIDKNSDFTGVRISSASAASDFPSGACSETFHAYPFWMQDDASCRLGIPSCHFMVGDLLSECQASSAALASGGACLCGGGGGAWSECRMTFHGWGVSFRKWLSLSTH